MRLRAGVAVAGWVLCAGAVQAQGSGNSVVYRCPGPPILYTDGLTAAEAKSRNCKVLEGAPVTVIQGTTARPQQRLPAPVASGPRSRDERVDPNEQRARDSDARRILQAELQREEEKLAQLKREFNNGEPERQGNERNYQNYLDRVAAMKDSIARKEADIAAIQRELSKLPAQ